MGFTGLALGALLARDGVVRAAAPTGGWAPPDGKPHFSPKAKSVIWFFLVGGVSHVESFNPQPELNKHAGKTIAESPYKDTLDSPFLKKNLREIVPGLHKVHPKIFPMQIGYRPRGQSGITVSDWWPHVGDCIDEIAVVRSMWTTDNNHVAQLQYHTGRHMLEGAFPTIGSWVHSGLGSLNDNLPQFVVLGTPLADCCAGVNGHGLAGIEYPDDPALRARIKSYELAFRMQTAVPEVVRFDREPEPVRRQYGLDDKTTRDFGMLCLAARRLVERGVRFVQVFQGSNGGAGAWDAHGGLKAGHSALCAQVDRPMAGLLKDLKQRGLLSETIVAWDTEFGRTPGAQGSDGRDHHPYGFSAWLAGGGIKGALPMALPMNSVSTPWSIAIM
jgi:hypothetical protein